MTRVEGSHHLKYDELTPPGRLGGFTLPYGRSCSVDACGVLNRVWGN